MLWGRCFGLTVALLLTLPLASAPTAQAAFAGSTVLVSRPTGLGPVPPAFDNNSQTPGALSADGRYAVFESQADGFAPGVNPFALNILLRDTQTNTNTLVSRSDGVSGAGVNQDASNPAIAVAPDGHVLVAFVTAANNLVDDATHAVIDPQGRQQVWLRDVTAGTTTLVSRAGPSGPPANSTADLPALEITPGGPVVAFESLATNLGTAARAGIFVRTVDAGATELVSCKNDDCSGTPTGVLNAGYPALRLVGGDLRIAYMTDDTTITGDAGSHPQIVYAHATAPASEGTAAGQVQTLAIVSTNKQNTADANDASLEPTFSSDGNAIAFMSRATDLTSDTVPSGTFEGYFRNLLTGTTELLSRATGAAGAVANQQISYLELGGDLAQLRATFSTEATNLGSSNGDSYVRDVATETTSLLDRSSGAGGAAGDRGSSTPAISENGQAALFETTSDNLDAYPGNRFVRVYERSLPSGNVAAGSLTLVSRPNGTVAFRSLADTSDLYGPDAISADGRYVLFESQSASLSSVANSSFENVYVRDLLTNKTILISRASGVNGAVANGDSYPGGISADGTRVAFSSFATNLSSVANNGVGQVYVRDLRNNTTTLVSRATGANGALATTDTFSHGISANGNVVLLRTVAPLDPTANNGQQHVYVRNLSARTTTLVDRDDGVAGAVSTGPSENQSIDADGGRVAFDSTGALAGAPADGHVHIYVRDLHAHTTTLVSRASGAGGASADFDSGFPSIDAAGNEIAFISYADNLGFTFPNTNVFVRNTTTNQTVLISRGTGPNGAPAGAGVESPSIDAAGDRVTFAAGDPLSGTPVNVYEIFVRDLRAQTTTLVSRANGVAGAPANGRSDISAISASGNCLAFSTSSTNLGDGFGSADFSSVHLRVLRGECPINPPRAIITGGPRGKTTNRRPTLKFRSNERGVKFQCRIDHNPFRACRSPLRTARLKLGRHSFSVRAIDQAGVIGPAAFRRFTVVRARKRRQHPARIAGA